MSPNTAMCGSWKYKDDVSVIPVWLYKDDVAEGRNEEGRATSPFKIC